MEDGGGKRGGGHLASLGVCVALDLEIDPGSARLLSLAACRSDRDGCFVHRGGNLRTALDGMRAYCDGAEVLVGHNIIDHDLPHLAEAAGDTDLLRLPVVDTLRLNPLAFPRNPYHRLVKHYRDGRLLGGGRNDPELDARLTLELLGEQIEALGRIAETAPQLVEAQHWLATRGEGAEAVDAVFRAARGAPAPDSAAVAASIRRLLRGDACTVATDEVLRDLGRSGWPLAYALAWISVSGGDSVMPPWVRHRFPEAAEIVRRMRDTNCGDPRCAWCVAANDPPTLLRHWFGFEGFRPEPSGPDGRPLQEVIVERALAGESLLGILPTGTGKSVCYQLPALSRHERTGALTVVISPLVALMADQVDGLKRQGISSCVAINGLLSLPERHEALDKVRLGDAAMLLISPEQLRSPSVGSVLQQREIGGWVIDEAHCLSKWGHDFRPDYRYMARFMRELAGDAEVPPVLCLTATAKPGVIRDIVDYFRSGIGRALGCVDGGAVRRNLMFEVRATTQARKHADIAELVEERLPRHDLSGAVVYCATRNETKKVAEVLRGKGLAAAHFHAGLKPDTKREVQERFRTGELRAIAATSAFGMGVDKPDVRLVVHGDIPGSLESYVQEAGRAGRDRAPADCVLLFAETDVERQFDLSARSRLSHREIGAVLKALRARDRRLKRDGVVTVTPGEILEEDEDREFARDSATDDTRVKTAVAWLEEAALLRRDENRVSVFPSCLKVRTVSEAEAKLAEANLRPGYRVALRRVVEALVTSEPDRGVSTDDLAGAAGLSAAALRKALQDLERLGIAANDTVITVFVAVGVENASRRRCEAMAAAEAELIALLREEAPDLDPDGTERVPLDLRVLSQKLRDAGHAEARPDVVERLVRAVAADGREGDDGKGSLRVRRIARGRMAVALQRPWDAVAQTARLRRAAAATVLAHLEGRLETGQRGVDQQAETTLGALTAALEGDLEIRQEARDFSRLLDRALLWLHELGVATLGKGLTVFRPAMTIRLGREPRRFTRADYAPLQIHYDEQVRQIHVMAEYARLGLEDMPGALHFAKDYFEMEEDAFLDRHLPGRRAEIQRQTTPQSWRRIVEALANPAQQRIVADDREQTNVLVLAGPGSGKTRVLVHRIAYLVRVRREAPEGILALAYNRHAAVEIRQRLYALVGEAARGVTIATCHGLAMRLVGASFAGRAERAETSDFDAVLREAVALLRGDGLSREEAEARRETLIQGYRWILVDEYQDVGPLEYELIAAVAGRSTEDADGRLSLFAVGDDDQNIYAFKGASVAFIRRFEADYDARPALLIENYRSTAHIIHAANRVIAPAAERMKAGEDITVDRARRREPDGGILTAADSLGQGRVQVLPAGVDRFEQAVRAVEELRRLSRLDIPWDWSRAAVIGRTWSVLEPVRAYCEAEGIPVQLAADEPPSFWRLRETQALVRWLRARQGGEIVPAEARHWLAGSREGPWQAALLEAMGEFGFEVGDRPVPVATAIDWLAEWGRSLRRRQSGLLLLTAHRAKGLEFDDVVVLDGDWDRASRADGPSAPGEDADAPRRLFYVAMTRARRSLALMRLPVRHAILDDLDDDCFLIRRRPDAPADLSACRKRYLRLTPAEVDLGFAGRLDDGHPGLAAIAAIGTGDPLGLRCDDGRWFLTDARGRVVGRLARRFRPPEDATFVGGEVAAILERRAEDGEERFRSALRRDTWEVVLPELVYDRRKA